MSSTLEAQTKNHIRLLRYLTIGSWMITTFLIQLASLLPLFDTSPITLLPRQSNKSWTDIYIAPLLRWDAFHFAHIAKEGYIYEYQWAFFPGTPFLMRIGAYLLRQLDPQVDETSWKNILLSGSLAACIFESTSTLYQLTLHHFQSPSLALLVSLLSFFPSSPVTLQLVGYSEPFFTWLSYKGKSPS